MDHRPDRVPAVADVVRAVARAGAAVFECRRDGTLTWWAPEAAAGPAGASSVQALVAATDADVVTGLLATGGGGPVEVRRAGSGGHEWLSLTLAPGRGDDGDGGGDRLVGIVHDVTGERATRDALAASEQHFRLLAHNTQDVLLRSEDGYVEWVSPSLAGTLGWRPEEWVGRYAADFAHPDDRDAADRARELATGGEPQITRLRMRTKDGGYRWIDSHAAPFLDEDGNPDGLIVSFRVVDDQVAAHRELRRRASTDALTGLSNRHEAMVRLEHELGRPAGPRRTAVAFCDLDGLKQVNDTHGHAAGDAYIRSVAEALASSVRDDDLVARLGGDEILLVMPGMPDLATAEAAVRTILRRASRPLRFGDLSVPQRMSVGLTLLEPGEGVDAVLARADAAMYDAKRNGGNQVVSA